MFKKGIMMLVALVIVATMVIAPVAASASELDAYLFFDVDFNNQSTEDMAGNHTYDEERNMTSGDLLFEEDETLGRYVLVLEGDGVLAWTNNNGESLNGYDMTEGLTMETLIYTENDPTMLVNMTIFEANESALHFQEYNDGTDTSMGFRCGDTVGGGFDMANAYVNEIFPRGEWLHLLGVCDGTQNKFFLNGELKAVYDRAQPTLQSMYNKGEGTVCVGESDLGSMWGATSFYGKIAFARIYKAAATDEQVGELYEAATGNEAPDVGDVTPLPSNDPVIQVTPEPDAPDQEQSPATFDLGLVSLAAVALSSIVAIKKRR